MYTDCGFPHPIAFSYVKFIESRKLRRIRTSIPVQSLNDCTDTCTGAFSRIIVELDVISPKSSLKSDLHLSEPASKCVKV